MLLERMQMHQMLDILFREHNVSKDHRKERPEDTIILMAVVKQEEVN